MIGRTISHYKIIEKLGEGGMGEVYLAEDTKLDRRVALKFLRPETIGDRAAKERFIREAKAASALQHNNICTIHEIDETEDGQMYIVMDCYEGETLKSKIEKGRLEIEEAVDYTIHIAQGLHKAHERGIIHRDIKPANIMITNDGEVKILDFGLAKFKGWTKVTKSGSTLGTISYMSPEQVRGIALDQKSDIWSLGVLVYEMLSGQLPFKGEYDGSIMYSILNKEPEPVENYRRDLSSEFLHIINRALEKDAADRYPNMNEILIDLKRIKRDTSKLSHKVPKEILPVSSKMAKRKIQWISAASVVVICILIFWIISQSGTQMQAEVDKEDRISIAVMPFENLTGDENYDIWQKGIPILIQAALSTSQEDLYVIDSKSTFDVLEDMRQVQTTNNISSLAEEVASKLNVEKFIRGTIFSAGDRIRLEVRLQDVKSGRILTSEEVEGSIDDDFLLMVDKLSSWVKNYLEIKVIDQNVSEHELRTVLTTSAEAYRHYLRGYEFWMDTPKSIEEFNQAVLIDTNFIEAQLRLALKYHEYAYSGNTAERLKIARKWADKVYSRKDKLPQKYQLFIEAHYCGFKKTPYERIKWIKKILVIDPYWWEPLFNLGWIYCRLGQYEKAIDPLKKAVELSIQRRSSIYYDYAVSVLGISYHALGECNKELELYENYYLVQGQENLPDNPEVHAEMISVYTCKNDTAQVQYYINRLQEVLSVQGYSEAQINVWIAFHYHCRLGFYFFKNAERLNKAEAYYRQALALNPKGASMNWDVNGLNYLAYLLIDDERDIDEGVELAQRAVKVDSDNAFSLHALGWGYFKQGKVELAIENLQKADDLSPGYRHIFRKHLEKAKAILAEQN